MQAELVADSSRAVARHNIRAVFARRGFRRLLAARLSSQLGDGLFQAGLAGSVLFNPEGAATALAIATAFAVLLVPYSALGPFVGVFLDRWSRRQMLSAANAIRAVLVLPSAVLVWRGDDGPGLVATVLGVIALNRFLLAGLSASAPHVVDEPRLVTANSFATTAGSATYSGGLAIAATIFHLSGAGQHPYGAVVGAATLFYAASALITITSFGVDALGPHTSASVRTSLLGALTQNARGMVDGLRHLLDRPPAAVVVGIQAGHRGLYGVLAIATLLLYRNYYTFDDPAASMGGLLPVAVAAAAGAVVAALITPPIARRFGGWPWVTMLMASLALLVPSLGLPFHATLTVVAAGVVSLATQGLKIVTDTLLQVIVHDDYRGRVFSVNDTAINLTFVAGLFLGALTLPPDGHSAGTLILLGAGFAGLALWFALWSPHRVASRTAGSGTTTGPNAAAPHTAGPDTVAPNTVAPNAVAPNTAEPDTANPNTAGSG